MGKAIYQPKGKAQEYNQWAANFYNGCSGRCTYCFNKKGRSAKLLGKDEPTLKKSLINDKKAIEIFEKELLINIPELQEEGLFFNFVSDPFLPETIETTRSAVTRCNWYDVPVIILTKQAEFINYFELIHALSWQPWHSIGFTLTGHDELEPGCCSNEERIDTMKFLSECDINTWASIEPIIDFESSLKMIQQALPYCNHFKIGLESGRKYKSQDVRNFFYVVLKLIYEENKKRKVTVYWKESIRKVLKKTTFEDSFCVNANYKFWKK